MVNGSERIGIPATLSVPKMPNRMSMIPFSMPRERTLIGLASGVRFHTAQPGIRVISGFLFIYTPPCFEISSLS